MKKFLSALLVLCLLAAAAPYAQAVSAQVNGVAVSGATLYNGSTYVPIRALSQKLRTDASVSWEGGQAVVSASNLSITARPGALYIEANGRLLFAPDGVRLVNGTTLVPIRTLAKAFGASVSWNAAAQRADVAGGNGTISAGSTFYNSDSVYWLSRIINAESEGEPLRGKIAVGNVILNRVDSPDFPNSIYGVIFDTKWGVQFTPVSNGTINNAPSAESIIAAKLCLDGANTAGNSLFFFNAALATSTWIARSRSHVTTIGNHQFYA